MSTLSVGTIQSNTAQPPVIQNSSGTEIGTLCRAWVNFNGIGTVSINAAFNVLSITDNGVGNYTVNFANAMPDANYVVNSTKGRAGATAISSTSDRDGGLVGEQTTLSVRVFAALPTGTADTTVNGVDRSAMFVSVFR